MYSLEKPDDVYCASVSVCVWVGGWVVSLYREDMLPKPR